MQLLIFFTRGHSYQRLEYFTAHFRIKKADLIRLPKVIWGQIKWLLCWINMLNHVNTCCLDFSLYTTKCHLIHSSVYRKKMFFRTNKAQSEHWLLLIKQTSQLHRLSSSSNLLQPATWIEGVRIAVLRKARIHVHCVSCPLLKRSPKYI